MEHFGEGPSMGLSPHGPFTAMHTPQTSPPECTNYTSQFAPKVDPLMSEHTSTHHGHILDPSWSPPPYRTAVGTPVTPLAPLSTTCLSTMIPSASTLTAPDPLTVPSSPTLPSSPTPHIPFTYHVDPLITHDFHIDGEGEGQVHAPSRGTGRGRGCGSRRGVSRGRGRERGRCQAIDHDNNAANDSVSQLSTMAVLDHASNLASKIRSNLTNSMKALGVDILGVGTILVMKEEHSQLSHEAHECSDSIPEMNKMVFAVQSLGNIRVFCRCRPLSKAEVTVGHETVVDFDAAKDRELGILSGGSTKKTFKFDRVYTPKDDQVDVFADTSPMVMSVLDGYNVYIFAYGQTRTGKTFTMEGTEQNRGVNYRTLEELFKIADERSETFTYNISVSMLEVYNEQIRDLLAIILDE
ncbi:Kinesin-like protein KIN-14E [Camellia lanceoleosa]|uniref:Kinesin-like protein KIN-14E n=1 Tax=Camellia lanceoleosa TaxID=1840588 RepID=A0ACC0FPV4_9ERIC|nr:Kinesin-like protein KIN-14E [Camellia lanceoleosa]